MVEPVSIDELIEQRNRAIENAEIALAIAETEKSRADAAEAALLKRGLSDAPCDICGYNGPGYHQPDTHPCARKALGDKA